jgi:dihydrofolate reductase
MNYKLIVAMSNDGGIGKDGSLPWKIKEDLAFFSKTTKGEKNNAIIMGKNTWKSLGEKHLPFRDNYILSSTLIIDKEISGNVVKSFQNVESLDAHIETINRKYDDIWVIGGAEVYKQYLNDDKIGTCYITHIDHIFDCDTFFPMLSRNGWSLVKTEILETKENYKVEIKKYEKI